MPWMKNRSEVCPVCLSSDLRVHLKPYAGVVILRCRNCKNRVLSEWSESDKDYDDISLETYLKSIGEQRKRSACRVLDLIERRFGSTGGRLLDIGCAFGFLLEEARNRGWQTFGIEPNETVGRIARDKGLDVRIGHFPEVNFEPMQFDVVCLMDVLEHLDDPDAIIRNIRKVLRPGGLLVLNVPNGEGLILNFSECLARVSPRLARRSIDRLYQLDFRYPHLNYFAPDNLTILMKRQSFKPVQVVQVPVIEGDLRSRVALGDNVQPSFFALGVLWGLLRLSSIFGRHDTFLMLSENIGDSKVD